MTCPTTCTLLHQQLATTFVQYIVPAGNEGDPTQAALATLERLLAMPVLDHVEAILAHCKECDQALMGQAWEV